MSGQHRKPWKQEEDAILVKLVGKYGPQKWTEISKLLPGRVGKQCRERWHNQLDPNIKRGSWTEEEDWFIYIQHSTIGKKWALMAQSLPGRSDNSIKNHWNSLMKKRIPELRNRLVHLIQQQEDGEDVCSEIPLLNIRRDASNFLLKSRKDFEIMTHEGNANDKTMNENKYSGDHMDTCSLYTLNSPRLESPRMLIKKIKKSVPIIGEENVEHLYDGTDEFGPDWWLKNAFLCP